MIWRIRDIVLAALFVAIVLSQIYQRYRLPGWPLTVAKIPTPYAGWIVAAVLALVVLMFVFLLSRDPVKGPY
jgi:hypothetical protein